jgi:methionine aminopeptidase
MQNLDAVLLDKKLEELARFAKVEPTSNLIEPTKAEIEAVIAMLREGREYKEIKKAVRRVMTDKDGGQLSAKGFSYGQIREIELGMDARIAELAAKPVMGVEPVLEAKK